MAFPANNLPDPSTWFSNALITSALMKSNLTDPINVLPRGLLGDTTSGTAVTLAATSPTAYAGQGRVTFTLAEQRRVRIITQATVQPAAAVVGTWEITASYNSGASAVIGSVTTVGQPFSTNYATVRPSSVSAEGTALLAAGTYTAFGRLRRISGGGATDTMDTFYTAVYDVGAN